MLTKEQVCLVIGASHAGVNVGFALRKEGWSGRIVLFDADPNLPYHRPPLSKTFLSSESGIAQFLLKPAESYKKEQIELRLNTRVSRINKEEQNILLDDGSIISYDKLVIATGARPFIPPIEGLKNAQNAFPLRTAQDVFNIRISLQNSPNKKVVIIGGGYIGLEIAASLKKLGSQVTILEREERILARVTAPEMSAFFDDLHRRHGIQIHTQKHVTLIIQSNGLNVVQCGDGSQFEAEVLIIGAGIRLNTEPAESAGLNIENGIRVDEVARTSDKNIFAIGDITYHFNPHYGRYIRLESVQNAVDQAKVAAAGICGKQPVYDAIPWFWSDQYDVKLQIVGLSDGYDQLLIRNEEDTDKFSVWYFKDNQLLAVDAVNNAKAYVLGAKLIKEKRPLNLENLLDSSVPLKMETLLLG